MALSGSYDFSITRDDIIKTAHQHIGAIGEGESPSANQTSEAATLLNMLMKLWARVGMPLWSMKRGTILPFTGSNSIATNSHCVTSFTQTTASAAASSGASTITVTSATGFADTYTIGVEQDNNTVHWTTINGAPSGSTITLTAALTAAVASGNMVYVYQTTNRIQRPLRVVDFNIRNMSSNSRWQLEQVSQSSFFGLGNLTSTGTPNQIFYDPELSNGTFYIYPRMDDGDHVIEFTYHRPFQDFDSSSDNPDCPQEFYLPLTLGLASLLGPKFGVPVEERGALFKEAEVFLNQALETVYPEGAILLAPETR